MKAISSLVFLLLTVACSTTRGATALTVPAEVLDRGSTIYFGSSFPLQGEAAEPSFIYERRVTDQRSDPVAGGGAGLAAERVETEADGVMVATHITRDPSGAVAVVEAANHSPGYALARYTLHTNQAGQSGSITVEGDQVTLSLNDGTSERTTTERQTEPVVVGPTLVGFVFTHLAALRAKEVLAVRFGVLERLETIGFKLEASDAKPGQTRVKMTPASFFVSLAMAPIFFTFDDATGKLVRIEGRVPPKVRKGDAWTDFDARVEYRFVAAAYR